MIWDSLKSRAYVPYSGNKAVCIIQGNKGGYYPAVRIENISYPLTIPAVQAACCICLASGEIPELLYKESEPEMEQEAFWINEFDLDIAVGADSIDIPPNEYGINKKDVPAFKELYSFAKVEHSDFPVACRIDLGDLSYTGVNVEVSEWTKGLCAERVAVSKAIISGADLNDSTVHIATEKGEVSSPCGACRQVIMEHLPFNRIHLNHSDGTHSSYLSVDLLPVNFKSTALKKGE